MVVFLGLPGYSPAWFIAGAAEGAALDAGWEGMMRNRIGLALLGLAFLSAAQTAVEAQVKTGGDAASARAITISGSLDFTFVHRSEGINDVLENEYQRARVFGPPGVSDGEKAAESDNFLQLHFALRLDVELAEKVNAVLELENRVLQDRIVQGVGVLAEGTQTNTGLVGAQNEFGVRLGQAYIEVKEFLWQQLSFKLGIQDHRYDLRGRGNAFFMDVREAELAYAAPLAETFAGAAYYGFEQIGFLANIHFPFDPGIYRDQAREAGGLKWTYHLDDNLFVDLFYFHVLETSASGLAGSVADVQDDRWDEYVIGLNVDYNLDEKSLFNFIYAGIYGDDGHFAAHTVGLGIDYYLDPALEVYLEVYGQWGQYGQVSVEGFPGIANDSQEIDHEAYAGIVGLMYTFDHELKPWIDLSFTYVSGDDGNISTNGTTITPDTNHDFVSYEDNDATMILEENHFGLDIDSNYWKIQGDMGFTASLDRQDDFHVRTTLAWAELAHLPSRRGINPGANGLFEGADEELGLEWDVQLTWNYTESLDFAVGFAWLFADEDGFLHGDDSDARTGSAGGPDVGERDGFAVPDGEEFWLLTVDTRLRF